jgi:hypothetical protein
VDKATLRGYNELRLVGMRAGVLSKGNKKTRGHMAMVRASLMALSTCHAPHTRER